MLGFEDIDSGGCRRAVVVFFLLRLMFLPLPVAAGVREEWILVLQVEPGNLEFFGSIWEGGLAFCVFFFGCVARRGFASVGEMRWASRLVNVGGFGGDSKVPTAVFSYGVSPAAFQGWMSALRIAQVVIDGVLKLRCQSPRTTKLRGRQIQRKKRNSRCRDLIIISCSFRVSSVRKVCTVTLFSI